MPRGGGTELGVEAFAQGMVIETVAKVNSLTILLARLSRLCRKDEAQGAEGEV